MKVAVSARKCELDSEVEEKFGRCKYFLVIETESMEKKCYENEDRRGMSGVGISVAQFLADKNVDSVITGNIGPKALSTLKEANIEAYRASGKIKEAIEDFKDNALDVFDEASAPAHSGNNI